MPQSVSAAYESFPKNARIKLGVIRGLIFEEAVRLNVGPIEETLKWGEPAYLISESKSGSTIRLAWKASTPDKLNLFLNCRTTLVESIRSQFGDIFQYSGSRCVLLDLHEDIPETPIRMAISMALTYHQSAS